MVKFNTRLIYIGFILGLAFLLSACNNKSDNRAVSDLTAINKELSSSSNVEIDDDSSINNMYKLNQDVEHCDDVIDLYKPIFDSYFKNGFSKKLNEDFFYKGTVIAGLSGENDKEYLCYTVNYENNGVVKDFVIPSQEMSTMWLNEILIYLINQNTQDLVRTELDSMEDFKGVEIVRVSLDGLTRDINVLNNPYDINFNKFDWNSVALYNLPISIELKVSKVKGKSKEELIDEFKSELEKDLTDYEFEFIVEEY